MDRVDGLRERLSCLLIGMALGDAIGLPREGLRPERAQRMFGPPPLRHRLILGKGMCSDDTEHACMTAAALLRSRDDVRRFTRSLAWYLRMWFTCLPGGVGMATAKACIKLWLGFPGTRSGVCSAGNGPAMRAPIIGAALAEQTDLMRKMVRASTRLTHTDSRAEEGAMVVAMAAACAIADGVEARPESVMQTLMNEVQGTELRERLTLVCKLLAAKAQPNELALALGQQRGISGYINSTVPVAIFCWLRYKGDFRASVEAAVTLGGDTDTVGAIVGGLAGASVGEKGIPQEWLRGLWEWPRNVDYLRRLPEALADHAAGKKASPPRWFWPGVVPRNLVFLVIVLLHGLRRLLPPW